MLLTKEMIKELEDPNVGKWIKAKDGFTSIITDTNPIVHNHTRVSVTVNCYDPDDYSDKIIEKPIMTFTGNALVKETVYFHEKIVGPEYNDTLNSVSYWYAEKRQSGTPINKCYHAVNFIPLSDVYKHMLIEYEQKEGERYFKDSDSEQAKEFRDHMALLQSDKKLWIATKPDIRVYNNLDSDFISSLYIDKPSPMAFSIFDDRKKVRFEYNDFMPKFMTLNRELNMRYLEHMKKGVNWATKPIHPDFGFIDRNMYSYRQYGDNTPGLTFIVKNDVRHCFRDINTLRKRDIDAFGLRGFIDKLPKDGGVGFVKGSIRKNVLNTKIPVVFILDRNDSDNSESIMIEVWDSTKTIDGILGEACKLPNYVENRAGGSFRVAYMVFKRLYY